MTETPQAAPNNPIKNIRKVGDSLHVTFASGQLVCHPIPGELFLPSNAPGTPGTGDITPPVTVTNVLTNPSFENGTVDWVTSTFITHAPSTFVFHGPSSLKVDATAAQRFVGRPVGASVPVAVGEVWSVTGYVRGTGGTYRFRVVDQNGTTVPGATTTTATLDGTVQRPGLTLTIPAGVTSIRPAWVFDIGAVAWIDAHMVAKTSITFAAYDDNAVEVVTSPQPIIDDYPYATKPVGVASPWLFYYRECVDFCCWRVRERSRHTSFKNYYLNVHWGNANNWDDAARQAGIRVDTTPAVGSVVYRNSGTWGHVGWVTRVRSNGSWDMEEYNGLNDHAYSTRTAQTLAGNNFTGFIHFEDA